jgi:hypothetical protein
VSGRDHPLPAILLEFDHRSREAVLAHRAVAEPDRPGDQRAKHLHQSRDGRPSEALRVEPHEDEPGEDEEQERVQEHLVGGRLIALHRWAHALPKQPRIALGQVESNVKLSATIRTR